MEFGLTDVSTGTGFCSVTALLPVFVASAALVAVTVTVFGVGRLAGAVYNPVALIVPVAALPPTAAFTDHVTVAFEFPVTAAANDCVAPARSVAVAGVTLTLVPSGGVVGDEPPPTVLLVNPEHPVTSSVKIPSGAIQIRFTVLSPIVISAVDRSP